MNVRSLQDLALPDLNLPFAPPKPQRDSKPSRGPATATQAAESGLADFFHHPEHATGSPWVMHIEQQSALIDGLRGLFHGPAGRVRLHLWMFMTLVEQPGTVLHRDEVDALWPALRPDAVGLTDTVLQRFRDTGLLTWDDSRRHCTITPLARQLAQQLTCALSPLANANASASASASAGNTPPAR